jgi:hypothetical protein
LSIHAVTDCVPQGLVPTGLGALSRWAIMLAFLYLGAKHMVTGYDHLLFITGVIEASIEANRHLVGSPRNLN